MADISKAVDASNEDGDDDIIAEALARFKLAEEAELETRKLALDDLEFLLGKQWPDSIQQERERDRRPCLVINRLPQFVQQVTNDQRQNRPSIRVHPVDQGSDMETAKVIQGLIRHIEYNSSAEVAYDTAFESAAKSSFGYFRIVPDFVSADSFDQELFIRRVRNPFSVLLDPHAQEQDGSDAAWGFVFDDLSGDDYRDQFPDSELAKDSDWKVLGDQLPNWVKEDSARVVEYFRKVFRDVTIHQLASGETVRDEKLAERQMMAMQAGIDASVVKTRQSKETVVEWIKLNGIEVLETTTLPIPFIPIIPVYGTETFVNGKRVLESVIRNAKDPQRMYNYWASNETETIALAPKAPFLATPKQVEGFEGIWASANTKNNSFLPYNPDPSAPGAPQRQSFEPAVQAITNARMVASEDMKATTGIYDASLGKQGNETSGIAIQRRNTQAQTSNYHFMDNLTRALRYAGRILVAWIPEVYDTTRAARIIGDDGEQKIVTLNQKHIDKTGKEVLYDLAAGRYDVTVDTGPSFASKRQEAAASMLDFSRSVPQVAQMCADLIAKNMDWPGAQEISDRLKRALPPNLVDDPKQQQVPPQVQAQLKQMDQMIHTLTQNLSETTKIIETKKLELEHKERVELMKLQAQIEMKAAELGSKEDLALMNHQIGEIQNRLSKLQMDAPINAPNNFDPNQADGGNYAGLGHVGGTANLTGEASPGQPMGPNQ